MHMKNGAQFAYGIFSFLITHCILYYLPTHRPSSPFSALKDLSCTTILHYIVLMVLVPYQSLRHYKNVHFLIIIILDNFNIFQRCVGPRSFRATRVFIRPDPSPLGFNCTGPGLNPIWKMKIRDFQKTSARTSLHRIPSHCHQMGIQKNISRCQLQK